MSFDYEPFDFLAEAGDWALAVGSFLVLVIVGACGISLLRYPFAEILEFRGPREVFRWILRFPRDLLQLSLRRIGAIAQLTFRESVRRKALWVFGIFALLFMFGSWFLDNPNNRVDLQVKNYISFVLTTITWLILPVVILLSCWGLPEDIRNRSLHTVVTKPVRKTEIVIGRMVGFGILTTILVLIMGVAGFFWIDREVAHSLNAYSETLVDGGVEKVVEFVVDDNGVKVTVTVDETPTVTTAASRSVLRQQSPEVYRLAEQARLQALNRYLVAKRPVYGILSFKGADGRPTEKGVNTGDIWEYRTYIEGGNQWRAIWDFENIDAGSDSDVWLLESSFEAFRTHKGSDISKSLLLQYSLARVRRRTFEDDSGRVISAAVVRKAGDDAFEAHVDGQTVRVKAVPVSAREVEVRDNRYVLVSDPLVVVELIEEKRVPLSSFNISEFGENVTVLKREIDYYDQDSGQREKLDLFKDLINDQGELRVEVACLDSGQYLGMARRDLFVKLPSNRFVVGYAKAIFAVWLMLVLVVVLGVTSSCFLKGPIAMLLTFNFLIVGQGFRQFLEKIVGGEVDGGGPLESIIRIVRQINLTDDLPDTFFYNAVAAIDGFLNQGLWIVQNIIPDFRNFRVAPYVANGFDVPWSQALAPSIGVTLAYLIPCLIVGYYSLSLRELEHK